MSALPAAVSPRPQAQCLHTAGFREDWLSEYRTRGQGGEAEQGPERNCEGRAHLLALRGKAAETGGISGGFLTRD